MAKAKAEDLESRLKALEAENAKLRETVESESTPTPKQWGRRILAAVLITLGVFLAPVAVVGGWAKNQLSSTEGFVRTFAPLAENKSLQDFVSQKISTAIIDGVNVDKVTGEVFDGLEGLGLPSQAADALALLKGPAAEGVKSLISQSVQKIVTSEVFTDALQNSLRITHEEFVAMIQGDPNSKLVLGDDGTLGLELGPVVKEVQQALIDRGVGFASLIPEVNLTVTLLQDNNLALLRPAYNLTVALGNWIPWAALGLIIAGILVSVRRSNALFNASVGLALLVGTLSAGFGIVRIIYLAAVSPSILPTGAALAVYDQLTRDMASTATAVALIALLIAIVTWFVSKPSAVSLRRLSNAGIGAVRTWAEEHNVSTGRFGTALYRYRVLIRAGIAVIVGLVLMLTRPLTTDLVIGTSVTALLVLLVVELLSRPEPELEAAK